MEDRKYDCLIAFNAATPEERYAAREAVLRGKGTPLQWAISEGQNIARDIAEDAERATPTADGAE